ncbi:MAG: protein-glutamate O-methyltransferase CheR [Bdellovibrionota bacterium]
MSAHIEERVGITYTARDRDLLQEKVSSRAREMGFESFLDYYYFLKYDAGGERELNDLVETLVVNETYFFREWPAIRTLVDSFIVPWCAEGRRPRIWSSACATGEEPLSLAMLLDDLDLLDKVEITATDISSRVLAKAKSGKFSKRAVRSVPEPKLLEKYLVSTPSGFEVRQDLISTIKWQQKNLMEPEQIRQLGSFDAILCRNVLIYFSDQVIRSVLDTMSKSLVPDGALVIGVSESLLRYSGHFSGEERGGAFVYRKVSNK